MVGANYESIKKSKFRIDNWKEGEWSVYCRYDPEEAGQYVITVLWNDEHIKNSPFTVQVRNRPEFVLDIPMQGDEFKPRVY